MSSPVTALANLIRLKQERGGEKFVLMLGAGASLASGMPLTDLVKKELVDRFGTAVPGASTSERFDRFWEQTTQTHRDVMLQIYFDRLAPSPGYQALSGLIKEGYFDVVVTLNFDNVLEDALEEIGLTDRSVIVRNDHDDDALCRLMEKQDPRVRILKLHGGAKGADTFLFTKDEMLDYPTKIRNLVGELTSRDIIVCGYGFEDLCMQRAFSLSGESIFWVNPAGAPANLKPAMTRRKSADNVIDKVDGRFDEFFGALAAALRPTVEAATPPPVNPFKFLEGYTASDHDWFVLRRPLTTRLMGRLLSDQPRMIHVIGKPRVGKTSFVRAGLMASLERSPKPFRPLYLRCRGNLETWLTEELAPYVSDLSPAMSVPAQFDALVRSSTGRVVLILDQFERMVRKVPESGTGRARLKEWISNLRDSTPPEMTVIIVGPTDANYLYSLNELGIEWLMIDAFQPRHVRRIISALSRKAGIAFEREAIDRIVQKYADAAGTFTLTHVQAVCHLLCASGRVDLSAVERVERDELASLEQVLNNQYDLFGLMEDIPFQAQQIVLRQITKFISEPGRQRLAGCLRDRFTEIFAGPVRSPAPSMTAH